MANGKKDDKSFDPNDFDFGGGDDASSTNEPFDFSFDDMPAPGSQAPARNDFAKPVDDGGFGDDEDFGATTGSPTNSSFGDLDVDDGFGPSAGFDSAPKDGFAPAESFAPVGDDAFSNDSYGNDSFAGEDEPVLVDANADEFEEVQEIESEEVVDGNADNRTFLQKNIFNIAAAVVGVFVLGFGWMYFSPMLLGPAQPPQQTIAVPNDVGTSMPGAPVPSETPAFVQETNVPMLPGDTASVPETTIPSPTLPAPSLPDAGTTPTPVLPGSPSIDLGTAPTPVPTDFGGNDVASAADGQEVLELRSLVSDLADQVESLKTQVATLEARPAAPSTPEPAVGAPDKPPVLDGWVLKGVQNGVAWVEGPNGFVEVQEGSTLPGAGQVQNITLYEGDWMIVTEQGVILQN